MVLASFNYIKLNIYFIQNFFDFLLIEIFHLKFLG